MARSDGPELFFGLVGAVGADLKAVAEALQTELREVGYNSHIIRVIKELRFIEQYKNLPDDPLNERYKAHMDAGDDFRAKTMNNAVIIKTL